MYDTDHPVRLNGRVESFEWRNPHSLLRLQSTDAGGQTIAYELECASISQLQGRGWPRDIVKPGERVTVTAALRRDVATRGEVLKLILPDGRQLTNQIGR
jgi:hypothetical protein